MKKISLLIGLALVLCSHSTQAQTSVLGTNDYGRIFNLLYDKTTENKVYALAMTNHILVSNDNGTSWSILYSLPTNNGSAIEQLKLINDGEDLSFVIKDSSSKVAIFNLQSNTITKVFTMPNASDYPWITNYSFFPGDDEKLLVDTNWKEGLNNKGKTYLTHNNGQDWTQLYFTDEHDYVFINNLTFNPENANELYLLRGLGSTDVDGGLWKSTDSGSTWTESLTGVPLVAIDFNPDNSQEAYLGTAISFGGSAEALYHTTDNGANWEAVNINWGTSGILNNIIEIKYNENDPNKIIVLEEDEVVYSLNGGQTWTQTIYDYDSLDSYYYGINATFNPFNSSEILMGANYKPLRTFDGGQTVTQIGSPFFSSTGRVGLFKNNESQDLYYGVQAGIVHRNLETDTDTPYQLQALNVVTTADSGMSYVVDQENAGRVFTFETSFIGASLKVSDDYLNSTNFLLSYYASNLLNVTNVPNQNKNVWASLSNYGDGLVFKIDFSDIENVLTEELILPSTETVNAVNFINNSSSEVVIAQGNSLYKSLDGGTTWNAIYEIDSSAMIYDFAIDKLDTNHWAIATSTGIYISEDAGENWQQYLTEKVQKIQFSDVNSGKIIGINYSGLYSIFNIYVSNDAGHTWETVGRDEYYYVYSGSATVDFADNHARIYIASSDLGLLAFDLDFQTLGMQPIDQVNKNYVYPNPIKDVVHFNVENFASATVYNMAGQNILETNKQSENWSGLNSGVYVLKIKTTKGEIFTQKVIKK